VVAYVSKIHKAPGHDLITNKILKNLSKKCIFLLTRISNSMLRLSYFPSIWKLAVIIHIPKKAKSINLTSYYRSVSYQL